MIEERFIQTSRLNQHIRYSEGNKETFLLIHGNGSSSIYWNSFMNMADGYKIIAPDLRGYGLTEAIPVDATKGYTDFVEDIQELLESLNITHFHLMTHSLGGGIGWHMLNTMAEKVQSLIQIAPASPYGFGGTKGVNGIPCYEDFSGSGGGIANIEFAKRIANKDRSSENPETSPRVVIEQFYGKSPFQPENSEELLDGLLEMQVGNQFYPGDFIPSEVFPFVKPGIWGGLNAASPKYQQGLVDKLLKQEKKPPIYWIHGEGDQIVSNRSLFDWGTLGLMGLVPNYPGEEQYPPQPMVEQTRAFLEKYISAGGYVEERTIKACGHSPHLEYPKQFFDWVQTFTSKIPLK